MVPNDISHAIRYLPACSDALEAELSACMEGLAISLERSNLSVQLETNSAQVIALIHGSSGDRSRHRSLVQEVMRLKASQREIKFIKIHRSHNSVSNDLANFCQV